jgi:hypothetical protein
MDPFSKLPIELRLDILDYSSTFSDIAAAARASPALNCAYMSAKSSYCRSFIQKNLPGELLQDALAIVHFPRGKLSNEFSYASLIDVHLRAWRSKMFADPCAEETLDYDVMESLNVLYDRLWLYIKDYLSKATSEFLPFASRLMPSWAHPCYARPPSFPPEHVEAAKLRVFDMDSLSEERRCLIFRAFLHYELLCQIYGPASETPTPCHRSRLARPKPPMLIAPPPPARNIARATFMSWDYGLLRRYSAQGREVASRAALLCVREYIITVYGAMIHHPLPGNQILRQVLRYGRPAANPSLTHECINWAAHSEIRICEHVGVEPTPRQRMLLRMDGIQKRMCVKQPKFMFSSSSEWSKMLPNFLASAGFDLLSSTLANSPCDFRVFIAYLFNEFVAKPPPRNIEDTELSVLGRPPDTEYLRWTPGSLIRLYLQRAWMLLDPDQRPGPRLKQPYYNGELDVLPSTPPHTPRAMLPEWYIEASLLREIWICHGAGVADYDALSGRMMPFWMNGAMHGAVAP